MGNLRTSINISDNLNFLSFLNQEFITFHNYTRIGNDYKLKLRNVTFSQDRTEINYNLNNFGFRDKNDIIPGKPADILTIGCSQTFGVGVPDHLIWPKLLMSESNKTVSNLGMSGAGSNFLLHVLLYYFNNIGIPKYIFAAFPDPYRYYTVVDGKIYKQNSSRANEFSRVSGSPLPYRDIIPLTNVGYDNGEKYYEDQIIKLPYPPAKLIPPEESLSQFYSSIYIIQTFCKLLNIKFYWLTWHGYCDDITKKFFEQDYCLLDRTLFIEDNVRNTWGCQETHNIFDSLTESEKKLWKVGADNIHLGIHWHYHTAKDFIKKI